MGTIDYDAEGTGNGLQILNDENGDPIVLTSYKIIHGEESYDLSSRSKYMDYSPQSNVVLAISITDDLYLLELNVVNNANNIISFTIPQQIGETIIDDIEHTVQLDFPEGTNVTALIPTIEISENATISPESGTPQDFTDPLEYTVTAENGDEQIWTVTVTQVVSLDDDLIPLVTKLIGNYPNPFNPTTTITFSLATENTENTEIVIYNLKGQKIKSFPVILSGVEGTVTWNGDDDNGNAVSSGIYYYKLQTDDYSQTKKMIMIK